MAFWFRREIHRRSATRCQYRFRWDEPRCAEALAHCPPGCAHLREDCGLDAWVREHDSSGALAVRLDSLRRLLRSREGHDDG